MFWVVSAFQREEDTVASVGIAYFTCLPSKDSDNQGANHSSLALAASIYSLASRCLLCTHGSLCREYLSPASHQSSQPPRDTVAYPGLAGAAVPSVKAVKILCLDTLTWHTHTPPWLWTIIYFGAGTIHHSLHIPVTKQFQKDLRVQECFNNNNNN